MNIVDLQDERGGAHVPHVSHPQSAYDKVRIDEAVRPREVGSLDECPRLEVSTAVWGGMTVPCIFPSFDLSLRWASIDRLVEFIVNSFKTPDLLDGLRAIKDEESLLIFAVSIAARVCLGWTSAKV